MISNSTKSRNYESKLKKNMFQACGMGFFRSINCNDISRLEARNVNQGQPRKAGPTMTSVTELCAKVTSQLSLRKLQLEGYPDIS